MMEGLTTITFFKFLKKQILGFRPNGSCKSKFQQNEWFEVFQTDGYWWWKWFQSLAGFWYLCLFRGLGQSKIGR